MATWSCCVEMSNKHSTRVKWSLSASTTKFLQMTWYSWGIDCGSTTSMSNTSPMRYSYMKTVLLGIERAMCLRACCLIFSQAIFRILWKQNLIRAKLWHANLLYWIYKMLHEVPIFIDTLTDFVSGQQINRNCCCLGISLESSNFQQVWRVKFWDPFGDVCSETTTYKEFWVKFWFGWQNSLEGLLVPCPMCSSKISNGN